MSTAVRIGGSILRLRVAVLPWLLSSLSILVGVIETILFSMVDNIHACCRRWWDIL